jgi:uncharacterized protein
MRLYEGVISDFNQAVLQNEIADKIGQSYERYYRRRVNPSECRAWQQSLNFLKNSFENTSLQENRIVIEYELPYSTRRIDALIFGNNQSKNESVVLLELKQWSNESVEDCPSDGNIIVDCGRFKKEQAHPSLQVQGYHYDLKDFLTIFSETPEISLNSCAYCHNYSRESPNPVLFFPKKGNRRISSIYERRCSEIGRLPTGATVGGKWSRSVWPLCHQSYSSVQKIAGTYKRDDKHAANVQSYRRPDCRI